METTAEKVYELLQKDPASSDALTTIGQMFMDCVDAIRSAASDKKILFSFKNTMSVADASTKTTAEKVYELIQNDPGYSHALTRIGQMFMDCVDAIRAAAGEVPSRDEWKSCTDISSYIVGPIADTAIPTVVNAAVKRFQCFPCQTCVHGICNLFVRDERFARAFLSHQGFLSCLPTSFMIDYREKEQMVHGPFLFHALFWDHTRGQETNKQIWLDFLRSSSYNHGSHAEEFGWSMLQLYRAFHQTSARVVFMIELFERFPLAPYQLLCPMPEWIVNEMFPMKLTKNERFLGEQYNDIDDDDDHVDEINPRLFFLTAWKQNNLYIPVAIQTASKKLDEFVVLVDEYLLQRYLPHPGITDMIWNYWCGHSRHAINSLS